MFSKVTILGLGLIGGSIALDLKKQKLAREVAGYNRSKKGREIALKRRACDQVFSDPQVAVRGADLVIFAVPVGKIPDLAGKIKKTLKKGALITDVGSTKGLLVRKLEKIFPQETCFIGGHPIAGTEQVGMESAELGLFQNRWWIFTPIKKNSNTLKGLKKLTVLVKKLGGKTALMSPKNHDAIFATVSHLPHMIAYALIDSVSQEKRELVFAGTSFKDVTRVAASSGQMWAEICLDNRNALLKKMQKFEKSFLKVKRMISKGAVSELEKFFAKASVTRKKLA
jgi:prephenate dehydrogenase